MLHVVDRHSNVNDNVVSAAEFLGQSKWRKAVFKEIYRGKPRPKTAMELSSSVGCSVKQALNAGNQLRKAGLVEQLDVAGRVAYRKEGFLDQHKNRILRLANSHRAREAVPTKVRPAPATVMDQPVTLTVPSTVTSWSVLLPPKA